jgi:outer membrane protein OmpA-like peptidoglycan-associated protein
VTSPYNLIGTLTLYAQWTAAGGPTPPGGSTPPGGPTNTGPITATIRITNLPIAPEKGSSFIPAYQTNSDGTNITWQTTTANCSISTVNGKTVVIFTQIGSCGLAVTVAATTDYTSATSTATTLATSAATTKSLSYALTLTQVGSGAVRSNVAAMGLKRAGAVARKFNAKAVVTFKAVPLPGFVQRWSGACSGTALTCRVTMTNAKHVRVAFRAAVTLPIFYFATNMSNITMSAAQVAKFRADLVTLVKLHVKTLTIRAYADYRNGPSYNRALSQRRANSVTAFVENLLVRSALPRMPIKNFGMGILRTSQNLQLDRKAIILYI